MAESNIVERTFEVIELLVDHPGGLHLSDISRAVEIPKSAAHRILTLLVKRGFVEHPESEERYRLTLKLSALGFRFVAQSNVLDICQPVLDRLAAKTSELVRMTLWDGTGLTWVAKSQGAVWGLRYDPDMGTPVALHATASGRAWLTTLDEDEAVAIIAKIGYAAPNTGGEHRVRNEADLRRELRLTTKRGYGLASHEGEAGITAMAIAIPGGVGLRSPGTVSVAGPVVRMTPDRVKDMAPDLKAATVELGELWPIIRIRQGRTD